MNERTPSFPSRRANGPRRGRTTLSVAGLFASLVVVFAIGSGGCADHLLWAVGQTERIGFATSFDFEDERAQLLRQVLREPVLMVRPEERFQIEPIPVSLFESNRNLKAMCLLVDLRRPGPYTDAVEHLLDAGELATMAEREVDYRIFTDAWAKGQAVLLFHAQGAEALATFLARRGEAVAHRFDVALQEAIAPAVLSIGRNEDMEDYLREHYDIEIGIPRGYEVAEDADAQVVRLYRTLAGEPARFLMIHWMSASEAPETPEALMALRNRLGFAYYDGDEVLEERSFAHEGTFQDRPAFVLEGVWQNDKYFIGGPFRSFGFQRGDRYFLIDTSVFNPPGSKLPYLRETLAIARTFEDMAEAG